jgi:bacteriocin biosynthesis cyclodehydratase domain-containing protein
MSAPVASIFSRQPLERATVSLLGGSAMAPRVLQELASCGVGTLRLVGMEDAVTELDLQESTSLSGSDLGRPFQEVLRELATRQGLRTQIETRPLPASKLEWHSALRGVDMAVALITGPVLFHRWLELLNEATLDIEVPWLSVSCLDGFELHIGPLFRAPQSPCYKCYELRYRSNTLFLEAQKQYEEFVATAKPPVRFGVPGFAVEVAASLAVREVVSALGGQEPPLSLGHLLTVEMSSFRIDRHPLMRLPRCESCGSASANTGASRAWVR